MKKVNPSMPQCTARIFASLTAAGPSALYHHVHIYGNYIFKTPLPWAVA